MSMALKDWKKRIFENDEYSYWIQFQKKNSNEYVEIMNMGDDGFRVMTTGTKQKYFKTKTQAMRFATAYMKKH